MQSDTIATCVDLGLVLCDGAAQATTLRHMRIMLGVLAWEIALGGTGPLGASHGAMFLGNAFISTGATIRSLLIMASTELGKIGAMTGVISMTSRHGHGTMSHQSYGLLRAAAQWAWF